MPVTTTSLPWRVQLGLTEIWAPPAATGTVVNSTSDTRTAAVTLMTCLGDIDPERAARALATGRSERRCGGGVAL